MLEIKELENGLSSYPQLPVDHQDTRSTYISKLKWTHGETGTELHGCVNILGSGLATLDNTE